MFCFNHFATRHYAMFDIFELFLNKITPIIKTLSCSLLYDFYSLQSHKQLLHCCTVFIHI